MFRRFVLRLRYPKKHDLMKKSPRQKMMYKDRRKIADLKNNKKLRNAKKINKKCKNKNKKAFGRRSLAKFT